MNPDRSNIDRVALQETFLVSNNFSVRPGFQVKLSATQTNPNILEVVECTLPTDIPIGVATGTYGDPLAIVAGTPGNLTTSKISVTCFFHIVERAMAGTGGVSQGQKVCVDPGLTGYITAPASNPTGATLTWCPGFALSSANINEVFALAILPHTYVST